MTFNKKLVTSAVGAALTLGLGMQAAQAELLFPYVVKDANRTTVVTIIGNGPPVSAGPSLHLQYYTKATTAANTAACEPNSTTMTFTDNDIVTFDTAGILGSGPLFGDTTNSAPLGTSISYAGPRHGYLVVQQTQLSSNPLLNNGYWLELDLANGGAHGDQAINNYLATGSDGVFPGTSYTGLIPAAAAVVAVAASVPFWPSSVASTAFTVTPLNTAMAINENNQTTLQVWNSSQVQGAYDRNENGVDGTVPQTVRCVGRLTAAQLMPGVVANAAWAVTGGWGWLVNTGSLYANVYQVDTSNAAGTGKFLDNATRITSTNI